MVPLLPLRLRRFTSLRVIARDGGCAFVLAVAAIAVTVACDDAIAQTLPGAAQPGSIDRDRRDVPAPRATPGGIEIPAPVMQSPAGGDGLRFFLRRIAIEGATVYTDEVLAAQYADKSGREVSLADLYLIARDITRSYRNDGYVLSQAIVPAQSITDGVARILVVEGFINEVRLTGDMGGNRALVEGYARHLREIRPLNARTLERYLLLMNDLAGTTARSTLVPAESTFGAADLVIEFNRRSFTGAVDIDNRGGRALGPWRMNAEVQAHSMLGRHDSTTLRTSTSLDRRLKYGAIQHDQPVGTEGGKVGVLLAYSEAHPRIASLANTTPFETDSISGALSYTHPVVRSRALNVYARASVGAHDGKTRFEGVTVKQDRLRMVRAGATLDIADEWKGVSVVDFEVSQGIDGLGARETGSPDASREQGHSDFTKVTLYAARLQSIAARWSLFAAASAQHAAHALLASELFGFGGAQFGRGYDPSELLGDSGIAGKIELRYTDRLAAPAPVGYTAYGFWDVGRVWRRNPVNEAPSESAASLGIGLRFDVGRHLSGFGEISKPVTRDVRAEGDRDARAYVGLALRF